MVAIDGFMQLMRLTVDDPNFQAYLKQRLVYLLDKVRYSHNNDFLGREVQAADKHLDEGP